MLGWYRKSVVKSLSDFPEDAMVAGELPAFFLWSAISISRSEYRYGLSKKYSVFAATTHVELACP
jgi:hypothetical protein